MPGLAPAQEPRAPAAPETEAFPEVNLVDLLLAEQQQLQTPVAQFSRQHDRDSFPDRQDLYRHLIPLAAPRAHQQFAFQVELDKCTACKACVAACHSLNGLDDDESWREVGTLAGGPDDPAWQQTVTSACHHCLDPECLHGCPVGAYHKDAVTGIVRHLDDQCIGCKYCVMKCPYDVPKYSKRRGIVRKCDMCHQRLAQGEAPACVQACPTEAIRIITISTGLPENSFLPGAPDPSLTRPTTVFTGRPVPASAVATDRDDLVAQPAHWPLVFMLVFTQAGIGLFAAGALFASLPPALSGAALSFAGLACSVLHLGRPLGLWRFFLGLRRSWLSREILAFGLLAGALLAALALLILRSLPLPLAGLATLLGGLGVFTSVMVYADTGRPGWSFSRSGFRFFGTTLCAFLAGLAVSGVLSALWVAVAIAGKLVVESLALVHAFDRSWSPSRHSARLQLHVLSRILTARTCLGVGAVLSAPLWLPASLVLLVAGELAERLLFFRSVAAPGMPGRAAAAPRH